MFLRNTVKPSLDQCFHFFSHTTITVQNVDTRHYSLQILTPTFRILVFWDVLLVGRFDLQNLQTSETKSLWITRISQLLLFQFNLTRRQRIVRIYILTMVLYLGIHIIKYFYNFNTFKKNNGATNVSKFELKK